jgi:acyl-CoA oxidase
MTTTSSASYNEEFRSVIFGDKMEKVNKWFELFKDPVWVPRYNISLNEQREDAFKRLQKVAKSGLVSVTNFIHDPTNIFTAHEFLGQIDPSSGTKFTVHYNLFGGSIIALHTERHKKLFPLIDNLSMIGCFCFTELGYGNNAVEMETTVDYDAKTKEFVINSPSTLS